MTSFRLWHTLRTALWPIPILCVLAGVAISFATVTLDSGTLVSVDFVGGPDAALAILGAIAASMITLTGLVLTIVLVVVQLAMGQFSPRIVRTILYDRPSQFAIGIFAAAFAHSMLAMRKIASTEDGAPVPGLAILFAFGLVVLSIIVLILYTNHIGQSLRAAALIDSVGDETRTLLDKLYPDQGSPGVTTTANSIPSPASGVLFHIAYDDLVDAASEANCIVTLTPMIGDFVPAGAQLFAVEGDTTALDAGRLLKMVSLGPERTLNQDAAYGFRMLVDIAERCLSDAFDPTTAVQAIDRLHDCLRQLACRPFPSGDYRDQNGSLRLRVNHITWDGYVHLAFDEIRQTGAGSSQVVRRLKAALADLLTVAPPERRAPIQEQLELLRAAVADNAWSAAERSHLRDDTQGIGSGSDVQDGVAP
jgi:uncharacterized membrane protein